MIFPLYLIIKISTFQNESLNEYAHVKRKLTSPHLIAYSENCFLSILKNHFILQLLCLKCLDQYVSCISWRHLLAFNLPKSANPYYITPHYYMDGLPKLYSFLLCALIELFKDEFIYESDG